MDSDGITLSKINQSFQHLVVDVIQVEDLTDEASKEYLGKQTMMSDNLAERLVDLIGGRLLHLRYAVDAYQNLEQTINEDLCYDIIKECLITKVVAPINNIIVSTSPESKFIIECFNSSSSKPLFPSEIKKQLQEQEVADPAKVQKVIEDLVNANLLRYNASGRLMWHSKLVEAEMKRQ